MSNIYVCFLLLWFWLSCSFSSLTGRKQGRQNKEMASFPRGSAGVSVGDWRDVCYIPDPMRAGRQSGHQTLKDLAEPGLQIVQIHLWMDVSGLLMRSLTLTEGPWKTETCSWIMASVPGTSQDSLRIAEGCGAGSFKGLLCRLTMCFRPAGTETWSLTPSPGRFSAPSAPSAASWWLPCQYRSSSPISAASTTKTRERTRWERNRFFSAFYSSWWLETPGVKATALLCSSSQGRAPVVPTWQLFQGKMSLTPKVTLVCQSGDLCSTLSVQVCVSMCWTGSFFFSLTESAFGSNPYGKERFS